MNKKATLNILELGIYFVFITIVAIFIYIVAIKYLNEDMDTTQVETLILAKRLTYSDSCLAYNDGTRTYQGTIDIQKLNFNRLSSCFTKSTMGYVVNITDLNGKLVKSASNLNLRQEAYLPICKSVKGYRCLTKKSLVQYYNNNELKTGLMSLEVINLV